jgi:hypothetical protein
MAFESQVRESFGRCAYTHKTHEKMAERHAWRLRLAKWAQIILSALTAGGAVGVLFAKDTAPFAYGTAFLSVGSLIFNSYLKDLDPGGLAQRHRETASDVWNVRESYLGLLADLRDMQLDLEGLRERRDILQASLYKIYRAAPFTDGTAYAQAQTALQDNEELTFSEREIDSMLPASLRRGSGADPTSK